jgi:uncharacterized protein (TIGR03437 family)
MRLNVRSTQLVCAVALAFFSQPAFSQIPEVTSGGVVSAASWSSPVVAGELVAIFGKNLSQVEQSASAPLPLTLGSTSVTINGQPAPLAFVSPTQINAQVPSALALAKSTIATATIVVTTPAGPSAPASLSLTSGYPGFFSADGSGCGQAAALNITPDGTVSVNSPTNSAAPGDYIALFGTGFGPASSQPPDGVAPAGASPLASAPSFFIDSNPVPLTYAGLAPDLVGTDQINFRLPASARTGCAVPVSASQTLGSPSVTISVQNGRGQCSDPPIQSYGQISLIKSTLSGPGESPPQTIETFTAQFPSAPALKAPSAPEVIYAPQWVTNAKSPVGALIAVGPAPINLRSCQVPGYSHLSAGAIQIQPPTGNPVSASPQPLQTEGVSYVQPLPGGFIGSGAYTVTGTQGSPVGLNTRVRVGSPIQLQTTFPPGTVISSSQPLTIKWTGGDPGTLVKVSLSSGSTGTYDYSYTDALSGSLTIYPICFTGGDNNTRCSFELPLSSDARLSIEVVPHPSTTTITGVPGITGSVQVTWDYLYSFAGLTLGP